MDIDGGSGPKQFGNLCMVDGPWTYWSVCVSICLWVQICSKLESN